MPLAPVLHHLVLWVPLVRKRPRLVREEDVEKHFLVDIEMRIVLAEATSAVLRQQLKVLVDWVATIVL